MDAARIQQKIYAGYGKAAGRLGFATRVYRADGALEPMADANLVATVLASFNAEDMSYRKPNKYGKPTWYCVADGRQLKVGDILDSDQDGTFFIAAMQSLLPILVVQANATVTISRVAELTSVGVQGYSGPTATNEVALMAGWPASILQGGRGDHNDTKLPADTRDAAWTILLPYVAGVTLRPSDLVVDQLGRRFGLQSAELTDLGWRMTAREELA